MPIMESVQSSSNARRVPDFGSRTSRTFGVSPSRSRQWNILHKIILAFTPFALCAPLAGAAAPGSAASPSPMHRSEACLSAADKASLTRRLHDAVERGDTVGVVALLTDRDQILYEGAAGRLAASRDSAMPTDAIFWIASMTKPVTSVAAMQLIEQGKMKLDDPVSKYLPGFDDLKIITRFNEKDATYRTRPAKHVMTIRHLLTHTSGIGYGFANPIVRRLTEPTNLDEWKIPLLSDPGEAWHYGASTAVLGMIVEKGSGQSLEDYFQEHIFRPLGMIDTSYAVPVSKQSRVATIHRRVNGKLEEIPRHRPIAAVPTAPFFGDGGLYSTAEDYARFMRMILNYGRLGNTRILRASTVREMEQNNIGSAYVELQPAADPSLTTPFPLGAGHDKFGLGFQIASGERRYARYRTAGSLSWAGIYNTEFWIDPVEHVAGVIMMQQSPFYDDGAIRTLRSFEGTAYQHIRRHRVAAAGRSRGSTGDDR
jgi:methyl acetate hydrolase